MEEYHSNLKKDTDRASDTAENKVEISLSVREEHIQILEDAGRGNRSLGLRRILSTRQQFRETDVSQASEAAYMALEFFQGRAEGARSDILELASRTIGEILEENY